MAKPFHEDTKTILAEKVYLDVYELKDLARAIAMTKGGKGNEQIQQAAKNFALQEQAIDNSYQLIKKMAVASTKLRLQLDGVQRDLAVTDEVLEQLRLLQSS